MHESRLMQAPFVICPAEYKLKLDRHGPQQWAGSRPIKPQKMKSYTRTVAQLRRIKPWDMTEAADYLEKWLSGAEARQHPSAVPTLVKLFEWMCNRACDRFRQQPSAWEYFCKADQRQIKIKPTTPAGAPKRKAKAKPCAKGKAKASAKAAAKGQSRPRSTNTVTVMRLEHVVLCCFAL